MRLAPMLLRRPATGLRHTAALFRGVALALPFLITGCAGVLDPRGPIGLAERTILFNSLAIMLAIVIPTIVVALLFAWWFRASNTRARYRPTWAYSGRLELIIWSIPTLIILFLGGVIWISSHDLDPAKPIASNSRTLEVQVVALDWKWLFIYPGQGIASVNLLTIPAGVPVHFTLTSASVMNTFFVPQLGSMIYVMNGMATQLHLQADEPGEFYGRSAAFSGDGFSDMQFMVRAVPPEAFETWVSGTHGTGPALDIPSYARLAEQSQKVTPFTYRSVDPALFQAIVMQQVPPGPGPRVGRGGPEIHNRAEK